MMSQLSRGMELPLADIANLQEKKSFVISMGLTEVPLRRASFDAHLASVFGNSLKSCDA